MTPLETWMATNKLTDAALAARLEGLSRSQVCRIRRRKSIPTPQTAKKLEAITGIPAASFVMAERAA